MALRDERMSAANVSFDYGPFDFPSDRLAGAGRHQRRGSARPEHQPALTRHCDDFHVRPAKSGPREIGMILRSAISLLAIVRRQVCVSPVALSARPETYLT